MRFRCRIGRPAPEAILSRPGFFGADGAQGLVEYALVVAMVALVAVAAFRFFGSRVSNSLNTDANSIPP